MKAVHVAQLDAKKGTGIWSKRSEVGRKLKPGKWWAGEEDAAEEGRTARAASAGKKRRRKKA